MKIKEVTNPEEQLGLLRVIIDNTWSAIKQQADTQARHKAAQPSPKSKAKVPKAPYAAMPKPLPKPKPPKLTPLQLKKKRQSNLQAYAKAVQNTLRNPSSSINARQQPVQPINTVGNLNPNRDDHEKEAFLKQLRGEIP